MFTQMYRSVCVPGHLWCVYFRVCMNRPPIQTEKRMHREVQTGSVYPVPHKCSESVTGTPAGEPGRCQGCVWLLQCPMETYLVSDEPRQHVHPRARLRDHLGGVDDIGRVLQWASPPSQETDTQNKSQPWKLPAQQLHWTKKLIHTKVTVTKSPHNMFSRPKNMHCLASTGCRSTRKISQFLNIESTAHAKSWFLRNLLGSLLFPWLYEVPFPSLSFLVVYSKEIKLSVFWEPSWISGQKNMGLVWLGFFEFNWRTQAQQEMY